jgi:DNA-directed RNA polymerase subunit RPC12/RpoP
LNTKYKKVDKKIEISHGDPQPIDCPKCEDKGGYQVSDTIAIAYTDFFCADGTRDGGAYSDYQRIINEGRTAYCRNCGSKLGFKIKPYSPKYQS